MILKADSCGISHLANWEKAGYYIDTKRWYQWSRKQRSSWKTGSKGGLSPLFRWHKFLRNHTKGIVPEAIQMKQKVASILQKARLTNDRAQQFREMTLGSYSRCVTDRGSFLLCRPKGRFFCPQKTAFMAFTKQHQEIHKMFQLFPRCMIQYKYEY